VTERLRDYDTVIDWLFNQLANYQQQGTSAYKPGLTTIKSLLAKLGNPQNDFPSIHIAGTNGKGSVTHMIASIYQENGYKTGVFTSPHIVDFRERIKVNGQLIDKDFVLDFVNKNKALIEDLGATFFEITTAMAFLAFKQEEVDIAIIETGLGGRLDSTNVLFPELSIITNIGIDHTQFLGNTLTEIATEKGGIIKENIPVLVGDDQQETRLVFERISQEKEAPLHYPLDEEVETDLLGRFQKSNAKLAYSAVRILNNRFNIVDDKVVAGLNKVAENTKLIGRFQLLQDEPKVILDAAHNPAGIKNLLKEVSHFNFDKLQLIYGGSNDKDVDEIFSILPKEANYYFTEFDSSRSLQKSDFDRIGQLYGLSYSTHSSPEHALCQAKTDSGKSSLILVFGSFFIMKDILEMFPE
jgi:dihydrofolate synthase/folylpolyglutamate synthase